MDSSFNSVAIRFEFVSISSRHNTIAANGGVDDLCNDVLVGEANNKTVFWCVVLVLVLDGQCTTSSIVSLSFAAPSELDLESFEVGLRFDDFDVGHSSRTGVCGGSPARTSSSHCLFW